MDPTTAFVREEREGVFEVVVNFGPLSGREATIAEVDRLARRLLAHAERARLHTIRTHEVSKQSEAIVHQVVVEAATSTEAAAMRDVCEAWAIECAEERSLEPLGT